MPMHRFTIAVDPTSLTRSQRGQVAGVIYAEIDGVPFPERQWSDSVVVVLLLWIEALNELAAGSRDHLILPFMDAPLHLGLTRTLADVHVSAVDSRRADVIVAEMNDDLESIHGTAQEAASQVLRKCAEMLWCSSDTDQLVTSTNDSLG